MEKIEPKYVTFEQAKLLKEKGFQELVNHYYFEDGEFKEHSLTGTNGYYGEEYEFNLSEFNENWNDKWLTKKSGDRCFGCSKDRGYFETYSAPEQWQVVEWFRLTHNINITVRCDYSYSSEKLYYFYEIKWFNINFWDSITGESEDNPQIVYSKAIDYVLNKLI
jgi:hypothetical protein